MLRPRNKSKELAHSSFLTKDVTQVDRLNKLYEDDTRILDCEKLSKMAKKRYSVPESTNRYLKKKQRSIEKLMVKQIRGENFIDNERLIHWRKTFKKSTFGKKLDTN